MANQDQLLLLKQGVQAWNKWYFGERDNVPVDLSEANLLGTNLRGAHLNYANLHKANLSDAKLNSASLIGANLSQAILSGADLTMADLRMGILPKAKLQGAALNGANLFEANLKKADLSYADLQGANLSKTDLRGAKLSNCKVFGISAWQLKIDEDTNASDLIITANEESTITVDNIEVAQFIYLILQNKKLRDVIETTGKKAVLILGRFTPIERKSVLESLRWKLREKTYMPIIFDFEKPANRDLTETINILVKLSRFVIADLTNPQSVPHELMSFVPNSPSVAVQPIINKGSYPYSMFQDLHRYSWVLPVYEYETIEDLMTELDSKIIQPAEAKVEEIQSKVTPNFSN